MKAIVMKPQAILQLGIIFLLVIWSATSPTNSNTSFPTVNQIELADAHQLILLGKILILDVREKSAFDEDHLPNALAIPIGELDQRLGELEQYKADELIVYCNGGSRGPKATKILNDAGFGGAKNLKGGIQAWRGANYATVKG